MVFLLRDYKNILKFNYDDVTSFVNILKITELYTLNR